MDRITKDQYFLNIAYQCATRGTCLRRNYGAVIVDKWGQIISTGYTGQPAGTQHCSTCWRKEHNIKPGTRYEFCSSVHAEMNALLQAGKEARDCIMYIIGIDEENKIDSIPGIPCFMCAKMIVNAGIQKIYTIKEQNNSTIVAIDPRLHYTDLKDKMGEQL